MSTPVADAEGQFRVGGGRFSTRFAIKSVMTFFSKKKENFEVLLTVERIIIQDFKLFTGGSD